MIKRIFNLFLNIIFFLDKTVIYLTKRSILTKISDFTQEKSYKSIDILNKKVNFFVPNQNTNLRVNTYFSKEPETLEWIDTFEKKKKFNFLGYWREYRIIFNL